MIWLLLSLTPSASAQLRYDFVDGASPNEVLATVEFSQMPADHSDIVALSFTESGQAVFGLGEVYSGTFDGVLEDTVGFMPGFEGGLLGANFDFGNFSEIYDSDPPTSSLSNVDTGLRFVLAASDTINFDRMTLEYIDHFGANQSVSQSGTWLLVPEPHSASLLWMSLLPLLFVLRRDVRIRFGRID